MGKERSLCETMCSDPLEIMSCASKSPFVLVLNLLFNNWIQFGSDFGMFIGKELSSFVWLRGQSSSDLVPQSADASGVVSGCKGF